ncbi:MAG: hypothetical protein HZA54_18150 [Planctomycetes bacterium]|nr:hypothetical protein [Planctomycetota bacterium]
MLETYRGRVGRPAGPGAAGRARQSAQQALRQLGGDPHRGNAGLAEYDHERFGPFLGVSDEGSAAAAIRRAAWESPKARVLRSPAPLTLGVGMDLERLGAVGEVVVGPEEYENAWLECTGRLLTTTNVGARAHVRYLLPPPCTVLPAGPERVVIPAAGREILAHARPFIETPDGVPRALTLYVEFDLRSRRPEPEQESILRRLQDDLYQEGGLDRRAHRLGLNVRIGWGPRGRDKLMRALALAARVGIRSVSVDGVVRKEADRMGSLPSLLNYLAPGLIGPVLRHAHKLGLVIRPRDLVDPDTVARAIWSSLNTARAMGLSLGKYGLFPLTLEDAREVVTLVQRWFPTWSVAPVCYVDQAMMSAARVYAGHDRVAGIREWLKSAARAGARIVLIDTLDKSKGWRILRTQGDPKGLLSGGQIAALNAYAATLGIRTLWAGGITQAQAYEFGRLGVFGIYVTSAVSAARPVSGRYRRDPMLAAEKEPTEEGVARVKLLLEAGFLRSRKGCPGSSAVRMDGEVQALLQALEVGDRATAERAQAGLTRATEEAWRRHLETEARS